MTTLSNDQVTRLIEILKEGEEQHRWVNALDFIGEIEKGDEAKKPTFNIVVKIGETLDIFPFPAFTSLEVMTRTILRRSFPDADVFKTPFISSMNWKLCKRYFRNLVVVVTFNEEVEE